MHRVVRSLLLFLASIPAVARAQNDTTSTLQGDSLRMNVDAIYGRPLTTSGFANVALGGYVEANTRYAATDGITEGLSFQLPRLTLFVASEISRRVRFLTEIELEEGGREVNIEFASLDIEFHPLFILRGGIVLNPIGAFNQNHDGPRWDFVDRPIASTTIIPSTWSNAGFGLYGKTTAGEWAWAYEAYLTNGFDASIIDNPEGRTWLPAAKANTERFTESPNGVPLVTVKSAVRHSRLGEIGLSWMGGVYNRFQEDGLDLDQRRRVDLIAVDITTQAGQRGPTLTGEWVWNMVDVPATYTRQYGSRQQGGFLDVVQPVLHRSLLGWEEAVVELAVRGEYVDYNVGSFIETGGDIADDLWAVTFGAAVRPEAGMVLRANYGYRWQRDLLGNPAAKTATITFGLSAYF